MIINERYSISTPPRLVRLDALRGFAVALMIIYHTCYDLNYFQVLHLNLQHHLGWLAFRNLIVASFVCIVGISLVYAHYPTIHWRKWSVQFIKLLLSALLVSIVSFWLFKQRFIFFGVLHFISLAVLIGILFLRNTWLAIGGALFCLSIGLFLQHPICNQNSLQWLGCMTFKPPTEDYVPFLPWFAGVLLGILLAKIPLIRHWLCTPHLFSFLKRFAWLGRHSLAIYLLHQPLLFGIIAPIAWLIR